MKLDTTNFENSLFEIIDQVQVLLSQDTWDNIFMNCTKNEMLVLILLYRESDVNMSRIAEKLKVPLNTATGIVGRMEKKAMVERQRSVQDKRVVTIVMTDAGQAQVNEILDVYMDYGKRILSSLSAEELVVAGKVVDKVVGLLTEARQTEVAAKQAKAVRKIVIE